jgi:hypothetical protein
MPLAPYLDDTSLPARYRHGSIESSRSISRRRIEPRTNCDERGDDWADIIDMLKMYPKKRRNVVRLIGEIDARL